MWNIKSILNIDHFHSFNNKINKKDLFYDRRKIQSNFNFKIEYS